MVDGEEKVATGVVVWIITGLVLGGVWLSGYTYHRGYIRGACVEMCRPAKHDSDQDVNGGCLCIGSDKVLRFKHSP